MTHDSHLCDKRLRRMIISIKHLDHISTYFGFPTHFKAPIACLAFLILKTI